MDSIDEPTELRRVMSFRQLVTLSFGTIIGVGWVLMLGVWLGQAGSAGAVLAFFLGALVILLVGLSYAELASVYPVAGGEVAYSMAIFGTRTSFVTGWLLAFGYIAIMPFEAIFVGWILSSIFPGTEGPVLYSILGDEVHLVSLVVGLLCTVGITLVNVVGVHLMAKLQSILTYMLLATTGVFLVSGVAVGDSANLSPHFVGTNFQDVAIGVFAVLGTAPFWYAGFDTIPQAMEERNMKLSSSIAARAIALAIILGFLFYAAVITVTAMAMPREVMLSQNLPAAAVFEVALGSPLMAKFVLVAGLFGILSSWNAMCFAGSRVVFSMARGRMIPSQFSKIHKRFGTPFNAVLFVGAIGIGGAFLGRGVIGPIVHAGGITFGIVFSIVCLGVLVLRRKLPEDRYPYRTPGGPAVPFTGLLAALTLVFLSLRETYVSSPSAFPIEWQILAAWLALGGAFWWIAASSLWRNALDERASHDSVLCENSDQGKK